ncbi:MAG: VWA domain-containing protein [Myxococcota bacterium]
MSDFPLHFAAPAWGWGIWVWLLVVMALVFLERRGSDAVDRLVGASLKDRLIDRPPRWRRGARIALLAVSGLSMLVALMQPQWGVRFVATPRVGAEIMIAIDVSKSMLADDAKPTRLDRAKAEVSDLLSYLKDDYVGLIAFAGRASVLSPMTPDKSFLRLALDSAGPHSVSRGGTRLAEPILRAVAGMGEPGPAQRALILITDGEDHDSFALDAAKAAAEAGIKIIAIGFGDERGSEIYVRDRKSGARTLVRDGDGNAVVSRLDGDLLRELALATDGAFVPAGTGVLDLASIYDAHISRLTRGQLDERGRTIRDEIYQVFVLIALLCLVAAVAIASGRGEAAGTGSASRGSRSRYEEMFKQGIVLAFLAGSFLLSAVPLSAKAQGAASSADPSEAAPVAALSSPPSSGPSSPPPPPSSQATQGSGNASSMSPAAGEDPRVQFNRANERLGAGEAEAAAPLFRSARRDAVDDLELRYAATYNLGIAASIRAEALRAENPAGALDALYEAADWFREAAGMRPKDRDPRHNLDVTLRKALILADEIASRDEQDLSKTLDALIEDQRGRVGDAAGLLEEIVRSGELDAAETLRPLFREAATAQRIIVSDAHTLADRIERERESLLRVGDAERTPEDSLRIEQLEGVLIYVDSAIERMGQTRRQLRQRRAERAYRRGARALSELKRARDQLRSPVEQIGVLLGEVAQVAQATAALRAEGLGGVGGDPSAAKLPAYLTPAWNEAESAAVQTRVDELAGRLSSAAANAAAANAAGPPAAGAPGQPGAPDPAEQEALRAALEASAPLVTSAAGALAEATGSIGEAEFEAALRQESSAGEALAAAQEQFFDLRQLLDKTYEEEAQIAGLAIAEAPEAAEARAGFAGLFAALQAKNLTRAQRLPELLSREEAKRIAALEAQAAEAVGAPGAAAGDPDAPDPVAFERQRFEVAGQLLALAEGAMLETGTALGEGDAPDWAVVGEAAARSADHLDGIRTLFFTLAEHVRKLALDQVDLRDRAQDALALANASPSEETAARAAALGPEQRALETRGGGIADALLAQAESMPAEEGASPLAPAPAPTPTPTPPPTPVPASPPSADDSGQPSERDRIRLAAEHVALAQLAMGGAAEGLEAEEKALPKIQEEQDLAVEELQKALALLSPPPPPPDQQDQEEQEQQDQDEQGEGEESEQDSAPEQEQGQQGEAGEDAEEEMGDPSQLLQGVRDREAERRRDQEENEMRRRSAPVEKDW